VISGVLLLELGSSTTSGFANSLLVVGRCSTLEGGGGDDMGGRTGVVE
jgi:hypothetical protein